MGRSKAAALNYKGRRRPFSSVAIYRESGGGGGGTRKTLASFASASFRALFLLSVPSTSTLNEAYCETALCVSISAPSNSLLPHNPPSIGRHSQGFGRHASHLLIRDFVVWRKLLTVQEPRLLSRRPLALQQKYCIAHNGNECSCLAVLPQPLRSPMSFEANRSWTFSLATRSAIL